MTEQTTKQCRDCAETKPVTDFYPKRTGDYTRTASRCKPCYRTRYNADYRRALLDQPETPGLNSRQVGGHKAKLHNLARDPDFYKRIGKIGGSTPTTAAKGFAGMPKWKVSAAGTKGGATSRRGKAKV